jgi:SAM-dependent methyltransferase
MHNLHKIHEKTYDTLAEEYDIRVQKLAPVTKIALQKFTPYLSPNDSILDVGCAVGSATEALRELGFTNLSGIDISPEMLIYARKRNPGATFYQGNFLDYDFNKRYDAVVAFAFIHLFPKEVVRGVMAKFKDTLAPHGYLYIGTTDSQTSSEGFEGKSDYENAPVRYRKHWTKAELDTFFAECGFKKIGYYEHTDVLGKKWMDYILQPG